MDHDQTSIFVRKAVLGEPDGLQWIITHFQPLVEAQVRLRLRGHGTTQDVEDVAADVWLVTLSNLANLEARAGRLAPVLITYLGTTVLNTCNNFLRRRARQKLRGNGGAEDRRSELPGVSRLPANTLGVVTRAVQHDLGSVVRSCLDKLEGDKRDVLVLRTMEHKTNQEIGEMLGLSANTVAVRYKRALEALRSVLPVEVFDDIYCAAQ